MKKSSELLKEVNRLEKIYWNARKEWEAAEKAYKIAAEQERRSNLGQSGRDLEDTARKTYKECGCICGCRTKVSGHIDGGKICFSRCDDCWICG